MPPKISPNTTETEQHVSNATMPPTQPVETSSTTSAMRNARKFKKKYVLVGLSMLVIIALAGGATVFILSHVTKPIESSQTPQQQAAELAKKANEAATASANKGDTTGAIKNYNEALTQYQKADDKAGEAAVKLQLQYYQSVKTAEDAARAKFQASAASGSTTP